MDLSLLMIIGFCLAAYSIVANDAIQTLGTFLASNAQRPWWVLWLFACGILTVVLLVGWYINDGDPAWGRLERFPMPTGGLSWLYVVPPIALLILTRFGIPVSTTFLVLAVFAPDVDAFKSVLFKSLTGYGLAFAVSFILVFFITRKVEKYFQNTTYPLEKPPLGWVITQWCSTGFLWAVWLMQDLANIFAYLPREISLGTILGATAVMLILHAIIFYQHGGAIQKIVTSKTNTTDIRSATIIDFSFGAILIFKLLDSPVPLSTTWVFLGLLAGREIALSLANKVRTPGDAGKLMAKDLGKALLGLAVSVAVAFGGKALMDSSKTNDEGSGTGTEAVEQQQP